MTPGDDRAIVWDVDTRDWTDEQRATMAALLTLDLVDACEGNQMAWDAIADGARTPIRRAS